ncbi:ABC transporter ATP-binding protein [Thalassorhabdomicrobium marinisediminis]|uniref:Sulfonate ABC transporter ATP-binding protein n=1 Tax=Thalassorhabdomicrobium marinisediminis TaxID=2170577 RepID=A0A2T7FWT9_9RHOB|nr:ABC transporter ATP-binding protein [Thalassorhabdomicrobium marinisediminis]PVA06614.1 sulfonate ABC transporter ATP-binding protein [Thalassorhabdomicrobium marinisediminis]
MHDDIEKHARKAATLAIDVRNVSMRFGAGKTAVHALDEIDLNVRPGEFVSIVGRSGCGKSTLLRCITNLLPPTSGDISVMGMSPGEYQKDKRFGFVFQDAALLPWKTAAENIQLAMQLSRHAPQAKRQQRVRDLLDLVRLSNFGNKYPAQLSGGMRQRVSIARALSYEPEILMMDEPFGALDEFTRREMHDELIRIHAERPHTVLFVTHSLSEALYLSDRIVVLAARPGRVKSIISVENPRPKGGIAHADTGYLRQLAELEELLHE